MINEGISILICCYNSEAIIGETLEHIAKQKTDNSIKWEVILVDNGSSDNTINEARESWSKNSCEVSFRILEETIPGKSNALKKGLKNARYEFILICDDDNLLYENYLHHAYKIMVSDPQIGFLGGQGIPKSNEVLPDWFEEYKNLYACGPQGDGNGDITCSKGYVYGAGAVFRKSIFDGLDEKDYLKVLPGRSNENLVGGEDNLMGYIAVISDYKIWYSNELKFTHKIKRDRLNWEYVTSIKYSNGRTQIYLDPFTDYMRGSERSDGFIRQITKNIKHILSLIKNEGISLVREKEGNYQNMIFYYYLGKIKELTRLNFSYQKEYQKTIQFCETIDSNCRSKKKILGYKVEK